MSDTQREALYAELQAVSRSMRKLSEPTGELAEVYQSMKKIGAGKWSA